ncbi:MAG: hypothetical protein JKY65_14130 [Planctomycetes bacterium]|nr:hypothetical protein [Planctomycetota bacterium]
MPIVVQQRSSHLHCGFCKDHLATDEGSACSVCGVLLHPECWPELSACPTLGCDCTTRQATPQEFRLHRARRKRDRPLTAVQEVFAFLMGLGAVLVTLCVGLVMAVEATGGEIVSLVGALILAPFFCVSVYVVSRIRTSFFTTAPGPIVVFRRRT